MKNLKIFLTVVRMDSLNSTLARNNENGVQKSQWKQLLAELFCMVSLPDPYFPMWPSILLNPMISEASTDFAK